MRQRLIKFITFLYLLNVSQAIFAVLSGHVREDVARYQIQTMHMPPLWDRLFFYFCFAGSIFLIYQEINNIAEIIRKNRILTLCLAFFALSCLWAIDPIMSLKFSMKFMWAIFFGLFMVSYYSAKEIFLLLWMLAAVIIVSDWVFVVALPHYAFEVDHSWRGAYGDRNESAMYANIAFIMMMVAAKHLKWRRWPSLVLAAAAAVFIVMSHSATGLITLVALCVVFAAMPLFRINWRICLILAMISLCSILLTLVMADTTPQLSHFFMMLGKSGDLSGRVEIWSAIMNAWKGHMALGYGPQDILIATRGEVVTTEYLSPSGDFKAMAPHNLYIAIALKYGVIGGCLFAILAGQGLFAAIRQARTPGFYEWHLLFMVVLLVFGLTLTIDSFLFLWTIFTVVLTSPYMHDRDKPAVNSV